MAIDPVSVLSTAASLVAALFGILIMILGWLGSKIYTKLEDLGKSIHAMEADLRTEVSILDRRLTRVEAVIDIHPHGGNHA